MISQFFKPVPKSTSTVNDNDDIVDQGGPTRGPHAALDAFFFNPSPTVKLLILLIKN
jgi:hypothetical protein